MTKELAIEIKNHIERAQAAMLQARAKTPNEAPIYKAIQKAHEVVSLTYHRICEENDIDWRDR